MNPILFVTLALAAGAEAPPPAMFGGTPSRNMVSAEKNLPDDWDPDTGRNILWSQPLGSQSYGGPVVYGDVVFVGTNNENPRDTEVKGDKGVLMAFDRKTGAFLWQATHDKLTAGRVNDWPLQGVCSTPFVEDGRVYYVSNRAEVVCADVAGFADGNAGPYQDEKKSGKHDVDIVWSFDLIGELDVFPHNLAAGSPLIVGNLLYTVTGNGVDEGHVNIPVPRAPSFVALDKRTGKLAWESSAPGDSILHGSWSNPAYGVVKGRAQVVFPGGDGWLYAFAPDSGELLWKFDCNPKDSKWELGGSGTRNNIIATPVFWGDRVHVAVGQDPEHGEGIGHLWAVDASGSGDVTATHAAWHRGGKDFHRTISTVAITGELLFAADLSGNLYCLDAKSGTLHWKYQSFAAVWGSPFVADGKVYLGDEDGDVAILADAATKKVIREIHMPNSVYTTPVARDGVLFLTTRSKLYAIAKGASSPAPSPTAPTAPPATPNVAPPATPAAPIAPPATPSAAPPATPVTPSVPPATP